MQPYYYFNYSIQEECFLANNLKEIMGARDDLTTHHPKKYSHFLPFMELKKPPLGKMAGA